MKKLERVYSGDDSWSLVDGGATVLSVKEIAEGLNVAVCVSGSLRSDTEAAFSDELLALCSVGCGIIIDCKELKDISYTCQLVLLKIQQEIDSNGKGSLVLRNVPAGIYDQFRQSNLHELLMIE